MSSTLLEPVLISRYNLTQCNVSYKWGTAQQTAFVNLRKCLASDNVLTHYDIQWEIGVSDDASPYSLGAVLFYTESRGIKLLVYFSSRGLSSSEKNYSKIEEGLAIVFDLRHFQ